MLIVIVKKTAPTRPLIQRGSQLPEGQFRPLQLRLRLTTQLLRGTRFGLWFPKVPQGLCVLQSDSTPEQ